MRRRSFIKRILAAPALALVPAVGEQLHPSRIGEQLHTVTVGSLEDTVEFLRSPEGRRVVRESTREYRVIPPGGKEDWLRTIGRQRRRNNS